MKSKKVSSRAIWTILPSIIIAILVITSVSYFSSVNIIENENEEKMEIFLEKATLQIDSEISKHLNILNGISKYFETTNKSALLDGSYENFLMEYVKINKNTLGSGIWFEPYKLSKDIEYFGPYVYKNGNDVIFTKEYETKEYDYVSKDWYLIGKNATHEVEFSDLYFDDVSNLTVLTAAKPFKDNSNNLLGVITAGMEITNIQEIVDKIKIGKEGKAFLLAHDGTYISFYDKSKIMNGKIQEDSDANLAKLGQYFLKNESGSINAKLENKNCDVFFNTIPNVNWTLAVYIPKSELNAKPLILLLIMIFIAAVSFVIMLLCVLKFTNYLHKNINYVTDFANNVSNGDFNKTNSIESEDEFGIMDECLNKMVSTLGQSNKELEKLLGYNKEIIGEIIENSEYMKNGCNNILNASNTLENSTLEQVDAMDKLSNSVTNISVVTEKNLDKALEAADVTESIKNIAGMGNSQMKDMLSAVNEISDAASNISQVIKVINDIAFQTNILALNASVEAARAGEHGKGFSVVAQEVRALAQKSSQAASETEGLISNSVQKAKLGASIANQTSASLKEIVDGINQCASIIKDMANSNKEQDISVSDIKENLTQVSYILEKNLSSAHEVYDAAKQMSNKSDDLNDSISKFEL